MKKLKLFMGIALFVKSLMLLSFIIFLSIQKKSVSKAILAIFCGGSIASAYLLTSYKKDEERHRRLREMDAFYDEDYESAFDDDYEEYFDDEYFDFEDGVKLIPEVD